MRPVATAGVAWFVCVSCLLVTFVSPAKTTEPVMMQFGELSRVDRRNRLSDVVEILRVKGQFLRLSGPLKSICRLCCGVHSKRGSLNRQQRAAGGSFSWSFNPQ